MEPKFINAQSLAFSQETRQAFNEFTNISTDLKKFKTIRKIVLIIATVLGVVLAFFTAFISLIVAIVIDIVVAIVLGKKIKPLQSSNDELKKKLVESTLRNVIDSPVYRSDVSAETVLDVLSSSINISGDYMDVANQITGFYNGKEITCVDIHCFDLERNRRDKNDNSVKKGHVYAEGLLVKTKFNRNINGSLALVPYASSSFDLRYGDLQTIKLDNPEFERSFKVLSDDAVVAYSVLTAPYMETLIKLSNQINGFFLQIVNDEITMGIPFNEKIKIISKSVIPDEADKLEAKGYLDLLEEDSFTEDAFINAFVSELNPLNTLYNELECGNDIYA